MIFYIAIDATDTDRKVLCATQAEAKKIDKNFEQIDIPTDKPGLMATYQEALDTIHSMSHDKAELRESIETPAFPDYKHQLKAFEDTKAERAITLPERARFILQDGKELDQVADWIMTLDGWRLGKLITAVIERGAEILKKLG